MPILDRKFVKSKKKFKERTEWEKYFESWYDIPKSKRTKHMLRAFFGLKEEYTKEEVQEVNDFIARIDKNGGPIL